MNFAKVGSLTLPLLLGAALATGGPPQRAKKNRRRKP